MKHGYFAFSYDIAYHLGEGRNALRPVFLPVDAVVIFKSSDSQMVART